MMKNNHFEELFDILHKTYIAQYQEFDDTEHCYYNVEHVVPIKQDNGVELYFQFMDAKTGKIVHQLVREKDFDYFTIDEMKPIIRVTLHFKSEYKYIIYAKKL